MKKKVIAIFTGSEGHLSISQAIIEKLSDNYQCQLLSETNDAGGQIYTLIYKFLPMTFNLPYKISQQKEIFNIIQSISQKKHIKSNLEFIEQVKPSLCISTHYIHNPSLEIICREKGIPFINVLSDPRSIHPLTISQTAAVNLIFDDFAYKKYQSFYSNLRLVESGWFVRKEFEEFNPKETRSSRDKHLLFVSGSEGTVLITKLLLPLLSIQKEFKITISCGNNQQLFNSLKSLTPFIGKINPGIKLSILGFTKNLSQHMSDSDLVIGKAGPNTIFESVAMEKPFFAITHISGQEDGNLDIIKQYNLGFVEENPISAFKIIKKILEDKIDLSIFSADIKKLKQKNKNSHQVLKAEITRLIGS